MIWNVLSRSDEAANQTLVISLGVITERLGYSRALSMIRMP